MAGPTRIAFEEEADLVIQKGGTTVELRADGSVFVNGAQVVAAAPVAPAEPVAVVEQQPVQEVVPEPVAPPVAEVPPAPVKLKPAMPTKQEVQAVRDAAMKQAMAEGKPFAEITGAVNIAVENFMADYAAEHEAVAVPAPAAPVAPATPVIPAADQTAPTTPVVSAPPAAEPVIAPAPVAPPAAPQPPAASGAMKIGQTVEGKGVFIGLWEPGGLGKVFNVFAAPEDLTDENGDKVLLSYNDAQKRVAELKKDWHGHKGSNYENDLAFLKALKQGKYNGEWIIPPQDLVADGDSGKPGLLARAQNAGDLADTFTKVSGSTAGQWYWSSTETPKDSDYMWFTRFSSGGGKYVDYTGRDFNKLATRPIRVEPRP